MMSLESIFPTNLEKRCQFKTIFRLIAVTRFVGKQQQQRDDDNDLITKWKWRYQIEKKTSCLRAYIHKLRIATYNYI